MPEAFPLNSQVTFRIGPGSGRGKATVIQVGDNGRRTLRTESGKTVIRTTASLQADTSV